MRMCLFWWFLRYLLIIIFWLLHDMDWHQNSKCFPVQYFLSLIAFLLPAIQKIRAQSEHRYRWCSKCQISSRLVKVVLKYHCWFLEDMLFDIWIPLWHDSSWHLRSPGLKRSWTLPPPRCGSNEEIPQKYIHDGSCFANGLVMLASMV